MSAKSGARGALVLGFFFVISCGVVFFFLVFFYWGLQAIGARRGLGDGEGRLSRVRGRPVVGHYRAPARKSLRPVRQGHRVSGIIIVLWASRPPFGFPETENRPCRGCFLSQKLVVFFFFCLGRHASRDWRLGHSAISCFLLMFEMVFVCWRRKLGLTL